MSEIDDDVLVLLDDEQPPQAENQPWRLLVVDDEKDVHLVTRLALQDIRFKDRGIEIVSRYSAAAALDYLSHHDDVVCILLDVVMEDTSAGLRLVKQIREDLGNWQVRIVLRTGQPGYAPEMAVIQDYDINDYRAKTELTVTRLAVSIIASLRSYDQIMTIEAHRRGLVKVIRSSAHLFTERNVRDFASGVLTQVAAQIGVPPTGIVCTTGELGNPIIVAAAGAYERFSQCPLTALDNTGIVTAVNRALEHHANVHAGDHTVLFLNSGTTAPAAVYIEGRAGQSESDRALLRLFCDNVALGFETAQLFERLRSAAYIDPITGLGNRARLVEQIGLLPPEADQWLIAVDVDHFHAISGQLGYPAGNDLLRAIGRRIVDHFPDAFGVARLAADCFGLLLTADRFETIARRIDQTFEQPIMVDELEVAITVTGGAAELPTTKQPDGEQLMREALLAEKTAKRTARGRVLVYEPSQDNCDGSHIALASEMRRALRQDEFILHYQPKVWLSTEQPEAVEALVRWVSPTRGLMMPGQFIDMAEATGLIIPLGLKVLEQALKQREAWAAEGLDIPIAVNLSAIHIHQPDFLDMIDRILDQTGIGATGIEIEVTESSFLNDNSRVFHYLSELRRRGFGLALDDFGTGYSSLSYIHRMPLTTIKIDRSFVTDIVSSRQSQALVEAIVGVARSTDSKVVGEGIETSDQAEWLSRINVDIGQGYLYSRPTPPEKIAEWWRKQQVPTTAVRRSE